MLQRYILMGFVLWCCCILTACSTLPPRHAVQASYHHQMITDQTYLAKLFKYQKFESPDLTGYHILYDPSQALISRLQLIERAEKTLDLQYYIWDNDHMGTLALAALQKAADRGVHVRLLIDDNNSKNLEAAYYALDQHPSIEIRLFNPYRFRQFRALDLLLNFNRMTRRMHNKTFIADHTVALIGGRNMSNQYFNAGENFQFSDMDVILVGQAVDAINHSFDEYWNHSHAYPVAQLSAYKAPHLTPQQLREQLEQHWFSSHVTDDMQILTSSLQFDQWFNQNLNFEWVEAKVIADPADKIIRKTNTEDSFTFHLNKLIQSPQTDIDLVSAYFVPGRDGVEFLKKRQQEGVNIRILTNSFKANDVAIVHAFYAKYRKELLENNIEIYEFLPVLPLILSDSETQKFTFNFKKKLNLDGLSKSSLHSKFMAFDHQQVFIGSFNLDPRSAYLNTEIGVVLNSPKLAAAIHTEMDKNLMLYAYRVELDEKNQLRWIKKQGNQDIIFTEEPDLPWWKNFGLKILSWLPIEKQM